MLFIQLLEKGHVQSLAVLAHGSGEICCGFFHVVINKQKSSGQITMGFSAVMKKCQLFGRTGDSDSIFTPRDHSAWSLGHISTHLHHPQSSLLPSTWLCLSSLFPWLCYQ